MTNFVCRSRIRDREAGHRTGHEAGHGAAHGWADRRARGSVQTLVWTVAVVIALAVAVPGHALAQPSAPDDLTQEALYSCGKARGPVSVSFKPEVELKDLITWVMGFTCRNFVYGAGIGGRSAKVTIIAPKRMSPGQAWRLFLVALETMNLTVVPQGNVLRVVESAQGKGEPLPLYRKGTPPATAQLVRAVVRPEHIPVDELANALNELKSTHGKVTALPQAGILIITDYGSSISKMTALIREVDQVLDGEGLYLLKVQHADATEMAAKLQEILGAPDKTPSPAASRRRSSRNRRSKAKTPPSVGGDSDVSEAVPSKIIADERINALILLASEDAYMRVRSLVKYLDIPIDVGGSGRIHVYPLEHGDAEEVANTLNAAISGVSQGSSGRNDRGNRRRTPPSSSGSLPGAPGFEGQVRVTNDKPTNSLVVVASVKDFIALKDVIERLDVPRRQVFIEAMILEVETDNGLNLGTSFHGGSSLDDGSIVLGGLQHPGKLQSIFPATLAGASGLLGGLIGPLLPGAEELLGQSIPSIGVLFQALATSSNVNVLSTPHLLTMDNQDAEISVGQNIPYQAGFAGLPGGGQNGGGFGLPVQSVQRQDVALTLKITPHINASDMVRLEIDQEISDIASPDFNGLGPSWSKRTVKTTVVVGDQQSIVIGGLMRDRNTYTESKVPLLGDLPLLGYLFKYSQKSKAKTNLLIVLTPYVVKSQMDIEQIVQRKTRESQEFMRTFSTFSVMGSRGEIDYGRKRGLLEEINRTAITIERDIDMLRQATQKQIDFPEGPIEYIPDEAGDEAGGGAPDAPGAAVDIEIDVEAEDDGSGPAPGAAQDQAEGNE